MTVHAAQKYQPHKISASPPSAQTELYLTFEVTKYFSLGENAMLVTPVCLNRLIFAQPSIWAPVLVSRDTLAPPQRAIPWGWKLARYDPYGDHCTPVEVHRNTQMHTQGGGWPKGDRIGK